MINLYPTVNFELLDRVMFLIEQSHEKQVALRDEMGRDLQPSELVAAIGGDVWDQGMWRVQFHCGTALCFAGAACEFSGVQWSAEADSITTSEGEDVESAARRLLGLTSDEGRALFRASNSVDDLRYFINKIKNEQYREQYR